MYSSGITAKSFIDQIKSEADISATIPDSSYVRWLNAIEQLLYSEYMAEQRVITADVANGTIDLSAVSVGIGDAAVIASDVTSVYSGINQLTKCSAEIFLTISDGSEGCYYALGNNYLVIHDPNGAASLSIAYNVRPKLKTITDNVICSDVVAVPIEFIEMFAAKLRGEAYKLANEDTLAAKWLSDYNAQLESFKVWIYNKTARYGG